MVFCVTVEPNVGEIEVQNRLIVESLFCVDLTKRFWLKKAPSLHFNDFQGRKGIVGVLYIQCLLNLLKSNSLFLLTFLWTKQVTWPYLTSKGTGKCNPPICTGGGEIEYL